MFAIHTICIILCLVHQNCEQSPKLKQLYVMYLCVLSRFFLIYLDQKDSVEIYIIPKSLAFVSYLQNQLSHVQYWSLNCSLSKAFTHLLIGIYMVYFYDNRTFESQKAEMWINSNICWLLLGEIGSFVVEPVTIGVELSARFPIANNWRKVTGQCFQFALRMFTGTCQAFPIQQRPEYRGSSRMRLSSQLWQFPGQFLINDFSLVSHSSTTETKSSQEFCTCSNL